MQFVPPDLSIIVPTFNERENVVCALGAIANVGIASYLFVHDTVWVLAVLAVGAVWNYAVTAIYRWNKPRPARRV
jgi:hypothetical protein